MQGVFISRSDDEESDKERERERERESHTINTSASTASQIKKRIEIDGAALAQWYQAENRLQSTAELIAIQS